MFFSLGKSIGIVRDQVIFGSAIFAVLAAAIAGAAQTKDETIRVDTELTAVEITVTDKNDQPVRNLTPSDFKIFEDGRPTEIAFFEPVRREDRWRPLAIVFALDVSGSMTTDELGSLRAALGKFIDRLAGENSYFAMLSFGMEVRKLQDFTNKRAMLDRAYRKLDSADEGLSTHAYDAIDYGIRLLERKSPKSVNGKFPRRAVIVVTDGFPVGDAVSPATVIERGNNAETSVFAVIVPSNSRLQAKKKPLPTLIETSGVIERTGGRSYYVNEENFDDLFERLATEITSSYVLAFYPRPDDSDSAHEIRVESTSGYRILQNRDRFKRGSKRVQ